MTRSRSYASAITVFAAIALLLAGSWWRGMVPFPYLGSDAGNVASFAAGWAHPGIWAGDMVLSNQDNFRFYATIHIPLLIALAAVVGDYGTAFVVLLAPVMWIQAIGWYLFGWELFARRGGALVLGLLSFGTVPLTLDYYGTYPDAQPRFLFQAVLPFLLTGLVRRMDTPAGWPALFIGLGLTTYIHPVSSPSVALASWLCLAVRGPRRLAWMPWIGWLIAAGLAFVVPAVPFAVNYLTGHEHGATDDFAAAMALQTSLFGRAFVDGWFYLTEFLSAWQARWLVPAWGLAGAAAVWLLARAGRPRLVLLVLWMVMLLAASLGVTLLEQEVSRRLNILPVEIDTIRNLRYLVPILMALGVWGAVEATRHLSPVKGGALLCALAALWLLANKPGVLPTRATLACLASGRLLCPPEEWAERRAALDWLRIQLPAGTPVLPALERYVGVDTAMAVRYYALKPVVFCYKDGGTSLGYANLGAITRWQEIAHRLEAAHQAADVAAITRLAEEMGAGAILSDLGSPAASPAGWRQVFRTGPYAIYVRSAT